MRYNAGSEIYTQNIARGLSDLGHEVMIFSRLENPFINQFEIVNEQDQSQKSSFPVKLINVVNLQNRFQTDKVDERFNTIISEFSPDVVHFNHLNHLSLGIIDVAASYNLPIVFTLHDFWLSCPRGQFIQNNFGLEPSWSLCDGQEDKKCAIHCFMRFASGESDSITDDIAYWTNWVKLRRKHISRLVENVNLFIAPSFSLLERMKQALGLADEQIKYLDYGFDLGRLQGRVKREGQFTFGYIGTHIVTKGIHHLIESFSQLSSKARLVIWGRSRGEVTPFLKELANKAPTHLHIEWREEYINEEIVSEVFNHIDCLVVPSIWLENSPLVIHEAQQVRVPVITANVGGMADYVKHKENGLLFKHRNVKSLAEQMQFAIDHPALLKKWGMRGYLYSEGDVVSIEDHVQELLEIYKNIMEGKSNEK